jgi:hypothetical protein
MGRCHRDVLGGPGHCPEIRVSLYELRDHCLEQNVGRKPVPDCVLCVVGAQRV